MRLPALPRRLAALVLLAALASGCTTWSSMQVPAAPAPSRRVEGSVRLTLDDGRVLVLDRAVIRGDSIRGTPRRGGDGGEVSLALAEVRRMEEERVSFVRTTALTTVVTLGAVVALAIAVLGGEGDY